MKRYDYQLSPTNPFAAWNTLALKTGEMMLASAQVIQHRSGRIVRAGISPDARDRREFMLMGQEKIDAVNESAQVMTIQMIAINQRLALHAFRQLMSGAESALALLLAPAFGNRQLELPRIAMTNAAAMTTMVSNELAGLARRGLKPVHARAISNAKRLRKIR